MEHAVANGYLMATVKGYAEKRGRARSRANAPAPVRDWASDIARRFGHTKAHINIEQAPADSPLSEYAGRSFADTVAEARAEAIRAQRERQGLVH